jgi:hypothetical protein
VRFPSGSRASDELALARALLAHGKRAAARRFRAAARRHGAPSGSPTERLLAALGEEEALKVPLAEAADVDAAGCAGATLLDPPRLGSGGSDKDAERMTREYGQALEAACQKHWAHALKALRDWPERWVDANPDLGLFLGFLLYKADPDFSDEAVDHLKPLVDDKAYLAKRPALLYYMARAEYESGIFDGAVRNMERFLENQNRN